MGLWCGKGRGWWVGKGNTPWVVSQALGANTAAPLSHPKRGTGNLNPKTYKFLLKLLFYKGKTTAFFSIFVF